MTIEQTVKITEERRLHLVLPPGIPAGITVTVNIFIPTEGAAAAPHRSVDEISGKLWELCKDSNLTSDSFLEMKRKDKELEEAKYRRIFHHGDNR
jgi:hypothetical protein